MKTHYKLFDILVSIDGAAKNFEIQAVSISSAMADITQAFAGEIRLIQYRVI